MKLNNGRVIGPTGNRQAPGNGSAHIHRLRASAVRAIKSLSPERLRIVADLLEHLEECLDDAATSELLRIPGMLDRVVRARHELACGRRTPVESLRRKYRRVSR